MSYTVTHNQIMRLFGHSGLRSLFTNHRRSASGFVPTDDDEEAGAEDGYGSFGSRRRRQTRTNDRKTPLAPSKEGTRLMISGTFGDSDYYADMLRKRKPRLARRLMYRELGNEKALPTRSNKLISQVGLFFYEPK